MTREQAPSVKPGEKGVPFPAKEQSFPRHPATRWSEREADDSTLFTATEPNLHARAMRTRVWDDSIFSLFACNNAGM